MRGVLKVRSVRSFLDNSFPSLNPLPLLCNPLHPHIPASSVSLPWSRYHVSHFLSLLFQSSLIFPPCPSPPVTCDPDAAVCIRDPDPLFTPVVPEAALPSRVLQRVDRAGYALPSAVPKTHEINASQSSTHPPSTWRVSGAGDRASGLCKDSVH